MATTANGGGGGRGGVRDQQLHKMEELSKTLKEGERILAPTRRPDGSLRKPVRIRAGYVPQDEVAVYQPKGALLKKEKNLLELVPPVYDSALVNKPKSKSAKRNERKKEKRLQAALEKGNNSEDVDSDDVQSMKGSGHTPKAVEALASQMNGIAVSSNSIETIPPVVSAEEASCVGDAVQDIDKRIRALKKKIRLAEAQLQKNTTDNVKAEQSEKMAKLEGWRDELNLMESKKAEQVSSS